MSFSNIKIKSLFFLGISSTVVLILFMNFKFKYILDDISKCHKYEVTAITNNGEEHELICFEGDAKFDKDFFINNQQVIFKQIIPHSNTEINTTNPVGCVDMSPISKTKKTKDSFRASDRTKEISIIGNNYVSGVGVRDGKRFPDVMDKICASDKNCHVTNVFFAGPHINDIFEKGFSHALKSDADEILYVITLGDAPAYINTSNFFNEPDANVLESPISTPQRTYFSLLEYIQYRVDVRFEITKETAWLKAGYSHMNYAGTEEFKRYIRRMKTESNARGKHFSCAIFPYVNGDGHDKYPFKDIHHYIMDFLKAENIPSVDLSSSLPSNMYPGKWVSRCDYHPGPAAHEKTGKILSNFLSRNLNKTHDQRLNNNVESNKGDSH